MTILPPRKIELLAPAKNTDIARQAILHGADAVYIGASSHGARQAASNSVDDIARLTDFAHQFNAKIYVTVNTIICERELCRVERLIKSLYRANVDALIVQDMGILRMDIPPIQLHASTQCDNREISRIKFLESVGFSQIVLARELTLREITEICRNTKVPIETFVHGALCVSYSGRCHASASICGRSANRGECAQICRLPYSLNDSEGKTIVKDKHLLSLRDLNLSDRVSKLLEAGVSSFKIEGRLKDENYVKNIVTHYRHILDDEIDKNPELYSRSSFGKSEYTFTANPAKSFNRGFTHYFIDSRRLDCSIASIHTPKSLGEEISNLSLINNGDGISFFNGNSYTGFRVNKVENGKIYPAHKINIPQRATLYRTFDYKWERLMSQTTAVRRLDIDINIDENGVCAQDEMGNYVRLPLNVDKFTADKPMDVKKVFNKLGNTIYRLRNFTSKLNQSTFIPMSQLTDLRRKLIELLQKTTATNYKYCYRDREDFSVLYPECELGFEHNVANSLARKFYEEHGVMHIEPAMEVNRKEANQHHVVMTCRHCILRELQMCKRNNPQALRRYKEPLWITSSDIKLQLSFNCSECIMRVIEK